MIREDVKSGVYVENLTEEYVKKLDRRVTASDQGFGK
jgi:hypothetical protein